jgi:hypothetical protein
MMASGASGGGEPTRERLRALLWSASSVRGCASKLSRAIGGCNGGCADLPTQPLLPQVTAIIGAPTPI